MKEYHKRPAPGLGDVHADSVRIDETMLYVCHVSSMSSACRSTE
jgi:hypothetical protein